MRSDLQEIGAVLKEHERWHVWVIEFGITHSLLRLALHPNTYPRHIKIECNDCVRIEADIQGGPFSLLVQEVEWHGVQRCELRSTDGSVRIVCQTLREIGRLE